MTTIILEKTYIFNMNTFPKVFDIQSNLFLKFIYFNLLEKKPNIKYIKIKIFFSDNEGKEIKEMFYFKERPNNISLKNFSQIFKSFWHI
jgi:hypothetical protein